MLVPSRYRFSIIGLTTYPMFVLGLLNGNSPEIELSYAYISAMRYINIS